MITGRIKLPPVWAVVAPRILVETYKEPKPKKSSGRYTGLIIDARSWQVAYVKPSRRPRPKFQFNRSRCTKRMNDPASGKRRRKYRNFNLRTFLSPTFAPIRPSSNPLIYCFEPNQSIYVPIAIATRILLLILRIKPHAPLLVRVPVNSFEFYTCVRTPQAEHLMR